MSSYKQQYEVAQNTDFREMVLIAIGASAVAIQSENPANLTPPIGYDPDGTTEERQQGWHLRRSGLAGSILRNQSHYVEPFAFSVANNIGAYVTQGGELKYGSDQTLEDINVQNASNALFDAWAGSHSSS